MSIFPMMKNYGASIGGFCIDKRGRQQQQQEKKKKKKKKKKTVQIKAGYP